MDKALYIAMTGAKETYLAQAVHANNLANTSTPGFKSELAQQRALPVYGSGFPTRAYAVSESPAQNFAKGGINHTANPFDVAISHQGFFAVLGDNEQEGYTRRGDFKIDENRFLINGAGQRVLGDAGPINIPPAEQVMIADDGSINIRPLGAPADTTLTIGTLRLVNPNIADLEKRADGLFALKDNSLAELDPTVSVRSGLLESSNVNPVSELLEVLTLARKHELDIKMMKQVDENSREAARLLHVN